MKMQKKKKIQIILQTPCPYKVKELWSKSFGVLVFFLTRIKDDDDDLPKKLYYWVLCKSDLKHLNFCVSVAWYSLLWSRGQKLTPENYLFTFLPLFYSKYLKIFHNDEIIPLLCSKIQKRFLIYQWKMTWQKFFTLLDAHYPNHSPKASLVSYFCLKFYICIKY